ncbi:MAG: MotA/TolQ/ExbB proton channel family protein [Bdellovibrionales bacterium]|nr:MotA/TolQ/ExbB proton channel family protein [Bdellovibrionales bacterium]
MGRIDFATFAGVVAAFGLVFYAIHLGSGVEPFFDAKSLLIVVGGTIGATLINFPMNDFRRTLPLLKTALFPEPAQVAQRTSRILDVARRIRAGGPSAVHADIAHEEDSFFRTCLELLAEEEQEEEIRNVLEIELSFLEDRHRRGAQLFQTMGAVAPAMGLIGTLIGLVAMLQDLENPGQIGPAMALALLTTFYGAMFANLIFLPIAGKLRTRSEEEFLLKELTIEGIVGVAQGINPRMIERRLLSFLPPEKRRSEYE